MPGGTNATEDHFIVIYFTIALGMVASDWPGPVKGRAGGSIDFAGAMATDYSDLPAIQKFVARDKTMLAIRIYKTTGDSNRIIILVHGSGWHGMQFHAMARRLSSGGHGTVIVPDMRGHGSSPVRRGDVDHIGQMEEDMADLIDHVSQGRKKPRFILGGHSSGGGFVVRFAGGVYGRKADGFILLAPFLKYNAPTTRNNAGGWARPATRRIIGLSMLNMVGITALNHLAVIGFDMPKAVLDGPYGHTATTTYSHRLNTGFAPRSDYEADLAAMTKPFLVIAGDADEAFHGELYEPTISPHTPAGTYRLLPGITHMGVVTGPEGVQAMEAWLYKYP